MTIPSCPHCGSEDSVYRNVRASGYTQEIFGEVGYGGDMPAADTINFSHPKTLRCVQCNKIRKDLIVNEDHYLLSANDHIKSG